MLYFRVSTRIFAQTSLSLRVLALGVAASGQRRRSWAFVVRRSAINGYPRLELALVREVFFLVTPASPFGDRMVVLSWRYANTLHGKLASVFSRAVLRLA
jgi:hypothetical protein